FQRILTADKTNYFALVFAGHCCVELNDALEARKFYDQAVHVDEKQALAWQAYGQYYEKFAVYDKNYCNCLQKIIELTGDETKRLETKLKLAKCMSKIGKSTEAFQEIKTLWSEKLNIGKISKVVVDLIPSLQLNSYKDIKFVVDCYENEVNCCEVALKKEKALGYLNFLLS
uniref:Uncharacterized protein n=1 Tax=Romanomermis culicivorax TaxID=13658 RepID=A0A915JTF7_ROMCU